MDGLFGRNPARSGPIRESAEPPPTVATLGTVADFPSFPTDESVRDYVAGLGGAGRGRRGTGRGPLGAGRGARAAPACPEWEPRIRGGYVPVARLRLVNDQTLGAVFRSVRRRLGWRQSDVAGKARVSQPTVSRIERGHVGTLTTGTLRRVAAVLDIRLDLTPRWRAGDLDRLINAGHSALHEDVAGRFARELSDWIAAPEVSFSIYGERGTIDILAWQPVLRSLLVIELKTDIVDVNELLGTIDRKRRLAAQVARDRGWDAGATSTWLIVADDRTNRRRVEQHRTVLRAAFPADGRTMRGWLRQPAGTIAALSMWPLPDSRGGARQRSRVRRPAPRPTYRAVVDSRAAVAPGAEAPAAAAGS